MTSVLAICGLVVSIVGIVPIATAASIGVSRRRRGRSVVAFDRRCPVDVVLTLSSETVTRTSKPIVRPLTGIGHVVGATEVSRCLARFYIKKTMRVHLSGHITSRLDGDEVILGGPSKNEEAARFLRRIEAYCSVKEFFYSDQSPCSLRIVANDGRSFERYEYETGISSGFPKQDLCLIVAATTTNETGRRRRLILCSGYTSYGTGAAAEYFFGEVAEMRGRQIKRLLGPASHFNGWGILVAEAEYSGVSMTRVTPLFSCGQVRE